MVTLTSPSLVQSSMIFLAKHNIVLKHSIRHLPQRENDLFIMEGLIQVHTSPTDLIACNHCRLYLQVAFLSDIVSGDGLFLLDDAWLGQPGLLPKISWPHYHKPPISSWNIWRTSLTKAFLGRGRRLKSPLGRWLRWDSSWPWYYTSDGSLYSLQDEVWYSHQPVLRRNRLPIFEATATACDPPAHPRRATTYRKGSRIVCTGSEAFLSTPSPPTASFSSYLRNLPALQWCVEFLDIANEGLDLLAPLCTGVSASVMAVSDGSFKDTFGTAAWTLGTESQPGLITGRVVCPGGPSDHSSYRSELTGIYAILTITLHLCKYYNISDGQIELGCDGLSALETAFDKGPFLQSDFPDYDLVGAIYHLRKTSAVTWTYRHVKGHQDNHSSDLDIWAQCNVQMDSQAKAHLSVANASPRHYDVEGEPWQLWIQHRKVTSDIHTNLYNAIQEKNSLIYWNSKCAAGAAATGEVDWTLLGRSMKSLPRSRRVFVTKHTAGMCGVGKFMKRWKEWEEDSCPRCGLPEDAQHVWRCKGTGTEEVWNKALLELEHLLHRLDTDPTMSHIILTYLRGWWSGIGIEYEAPRAFQALIQAQAVVGWGRFFEGWLVKAWAERQQRYYNIIKSTRTGRRWAMAIILKLWNTAWDMWEHRNEILHKKENFITQAMTSQLHARVSRVYQNLTSRTLRHNDRHLVHLSLYKLLRRDTNYTTTWLSVAERVLHEERVGDWRLSTRSDCMIQGMRRCMFTWLRR